MEKIVALEKCFSYDEVKVYNSIKKLFTSSLNCNGDSSINIVNCSFN